MKEEEETVLLFSLWVRMVELLTSSTFASYGFTKGVQLSLAKSLFIQPTLLLLDEPTNHFDLKVVL